MNHPPPPPPFHPCLKQPTPDKCWEEIKERMRSERLLISWHAGDLDVEPQKEDRMTGEKDRDQIIEAISEAIYDHKFGPPRTDRLKEILRFIREDLEVALAARGSDGGPLLYPASELTQVGFIGVRGEMVDMTRLTVMDTRPKIARTQNPHWKPLLRLES